MPLCPSYQTLAVVNAEKLVTKLESGPYFTTDKLVSWLYTLAGYFELRTEHFTKVDGRLWGPNSLISVHILDSVVADADDVELGLG